MRSLIVQPYFSADYAYVKRWRVKGTFQFGGEQHPGRNVVEAKDASRSASLLRLRYAPLSMPAPLCFPPKLNYTHL
jgi:hypothetical protein